LLDRFSGAAAAYSLRYLSKPTKYSPVVKVRRSLDNTEQDFTAGEIEDGTLEAFVGAGNDGFVTTWYDQSGNGNDATQTTAASQPKIVDAGVLVTENGKAAVDFDGVDDFFRCNVGGVKAIYSVFSDSGNAVDFVGPTQNRIFLDKNNFEIQPLSPFITISLPINYLDGRYFLLAYNNNPTDTLSLNGDTYSDPDAPNQEFALNRIGNNDSNLGYVNGVFSEIIIYPSDQSANRVAIETNINNHYEIY